MSHPNRQATRRSLRIFLTHCHCDVLFHCSAVNPFPYLLAHEHSHTNIAVCNKCYGCSTVVPVCFTCPAITAVTVILRALDRVRERVLGLLCLFVCRSIAQILLMSVYVEVRLKKEKSSINSQVFYYNAGGLLDPKDALSCLFRQVTPCRRIPAPIYSI